MDWFKVWIPGHLVSIFSFLLSMIFVSFVLRAKRPPGSTFAWLLFILLVPYVGIPLYVFLSQRKFKSKKKKLYKVEASAGAGKGGRLETMLLGMGVPPPREAATPKLFYSGTAALATILQRIANAQTSIHLTTFIFAKDEIGDEILSLLAKKASEGVQVRLLVDSFGSMWVRSPSFRPLKAAGGAIAYFMPLLHSPFKGRSNLRNHRKIFIVDSAHALVGGMNIGKDYMGAQKEHWLDIAMEMEGEAVHDLEEIWMEDWEFACGEKLPRVPARQALSAAPSKIQIIASGPDVEGDPLYDFLLSLLFRAQERIWIATPYFIPDEALATALELAARRGVDVRIWVPRTSNHLLADLARATYLRELVEVKAKLQMVQSMMHGKAVLIDHSCGLVGSANFDMRSLLLNYEIGAALFTKGDLEALEKWFLEMPVQNLEKWPQTSYFRALLEGASRVLGPLI